MTISTIFFDLGNVLIRWIPERACEAIAKKSPYTPAEIFQLVSGDTTFIQYELGNISTADTFTHARDLLKYSGPAEELIDIWCDVFEPIEEHIQYAFRLAEHYPIALLSNTNQAHIQYLEERYPHFFATFRKKIYSYEIHQMKPDEAIYQTAIDTMQADRFETLFIDDREENVLTPSRMGWQTIHLRPEVNLKLALQSYDLNGLRALDA